MPGRYNGLCLGLGRPTLIVHGSHTELEPFKPDEGPCYHSPREVLSIPLLSRRIPNFFHSVSHLSSIFELKKAMIKQSLDFKGNSGFAAIAF